MSTRLQRHGIRIPCVIAFVSLLALNVPVVAAGSEEDPAPTGTERLGGLALPLEGSRSIVSAAPTTQPDIGQFTLATGEPAPPRPKPLLFLYGSIGALQVLDAQSTFRALDAGAREANPLMRAVVQNRVVFVALKAGVAASAIVVAEKMWRRNRAGAIALMIAINAANAAVVVHNYRVGNAAR